MKKFYLIFLAVPLLFLALMYLSIWYFIGGIVAIMILVAYHFYAVHLNALEDRNAVLENELEDVHVQLEQAVIKEQRTNKEVEKVRALKKQLLSVISHEVRTPMNGIMGMSLLLADTSLTKEQEEYLRTIRNCGETLLTTVNNVLVNDMLDFSKLEQQGKLEYNDFDLRDSVEEILEMFAVKVAKNNVELLYHIDSNVPVQVIADNSRLRQVLMNLVENAVKFTTDGEIILNIHAGRNAEGQIELVFEVKDTGAGIPKDQLKQLFKGIPGKGSRANEVERTGLGLVICHRLVEFMGGHIEVKSQPGQGSTFSFAIPLTPSLKAAHDKTKNIASLDSKKVLVVDDNLTSIHILSEYLKVWKMLPVMASSAETAIGLLLTNNVDLIITDLNMPGTDGIQLTKTLKEKQPSIPVILMNAADDERYKQESQLFASILSKPIRQNILKDQLLTVFAKTNTSDQNKTIVTDEFSKEHPLRILVAEDNLVNQKIAMKILGKLGYQPVIVNNGKEALDIVGHEVFDLILMDVQMPEMDGLEATRMIRTCLEVQPVIIALTANVMQGDRDDCMQAGMDDYASKPIDINELMKKLEKWSIAIKEKRKLSA